MSMHQILEKAINSHLLWVETFQIELANGKVSERSRDAGYDDLCGFGVWLYGLSSDTKCTSEYRNVKNLHYEFHMVAGEIVQLLQREEFDKVKDLIEGDYTDI